MLEVKDPFWQIPFGPHPCLPCLKNLLKHRADEAASMVCAAERAQHWENGPRKFTTDHYSQFTADAYKDWDCFLFTDRRWCPACRTGAGKEYLQFVDHWIAVAQNVRRRNYSNLNAHLTPLLERLWANVVR